VSLFSIVPDTTISSPRSEKPEPASYSITDGDVAGAIATGWPNSGVDVLLGIGGTPEGVIAAAALKGLGGEIQGVLHAENDDVRRQAEALGYSFSRVMTGDDSRRERRLFFSRPPPSPTATFFAEYASTTLVRPRSRWWCARARARSARLRPFTATTNSRNSRPRASSFQKCFSSQSCWLRRRIERPSLRHMTRGIQAFREGG